MKRICIFCGSNQGARSAYVAAAQAIAREAAARGIGVVTGGGRVGLMGAVADAALAAGGVVIGIIPEALVAWEVAHAGLTTLEVVDSMHARKARMADLAHAFVALPGGFGTLEEFCEVLTWAQLGLHTKACGLLNVDGYYDPFIAFLDHAVTERFVRPEHRALVLQAGEPAALLEMLEQYQPPTLPKWIERRFPRPRGDGAVRAARTPRARPAGGRARGAPGNARTVSTSDTAEMDRARRTMRGF
jgi:uncharacterized protein (TIGR00730 family)